MAKFTHRVRLHFRSISLTNVQFDQILTSAEKTYAQYGIRVEFGSGESMLLSETEQKRLQKVDGQCTWTVSGGEFADLQKMGGRIPSTDIMVFFVKQFGNGLLGCGGHMKNRPACIVASTASKWDTAHEVGHVLLGSTFSPVHSTDIKNLMHATASSYAKTPTLTTGQIAQMKKSPCCVKVA